jgi:hypothetical protein
VLDDIERLLEYVPIGPRFSNVVLQVRPCAGQAIIVDARLGRQYPVATGVGRLSLVTTGVWIPSSSGNWAGQAISCGHWPGQPISYGDWAGQDIFGDHCTMICGPLDWAIPCDHGRDLAGYILWRTGLGRQ